MEINPILIDKKRMATLITIAVFLVLAIVVKTKQLFDSFNHLDNMVESQSNEINHLRATIEEHETEIDDLKSKVEDLELER